jgi:hypothetical protein
MTKPHATHTSEAKLLRRIKIAAMRKASKNPWPEIKGLINETKRKSI